ncbi:PTS sugar transporter subunit IIB (plasmid) [Staphylococcus pseudoxylosus]|uniref:PTS sugar transporter subunit IIB n=1 Tax=Staphylococcus pseudoxylosus TaxID=2282419 RepID=UPI0034D38C04
MSNNKLEIIIACGSGVATSTIAAEEVKEILDELNIKYNINKISMQQLSSYEDSADVILTTNNYKNEDVPSRNVMGFVTGLDEDELREDLSELFTKLVE